MHLVVAGLNHQTAPIEVRERLAVSETAMPDVLARLRSAPNVSEAAILSTCNRTEIYALIRAHSDATVLPRVLCESRGVPPGEITAHLYTRSQDEAAAHLMRVASGLDSLVLGEPQILRQVRDAFAAAEHAGTAGQVLNALFRASIVAGRRARTETDISRGGFSVGHAAVDLARSIFGSLESASIMILGAGKMSELTARHLVNSGIRMVMVANRTYEKASALADRLGGRAIRYDDFPQTLTSTDIVISSTASPVHVVTRELLQPTLRKRRGRPLILIDIAVPRDIAPDVAALDNVFLYDLDDLQAVVADMARDRQAEAHKVEAIVADETAKLMAWWRSQDAVPVVARLQQKQASLREAEISRLRNQLPELSDHAWTKIEAAMLSLTNRISRHAVQRMKQAAAHGDSEHAQELLDAAVELFGLDMGAAGHEYRSPNGAGASQSDQSGAAERRQEVAR